MAKKMERERGRAERVWKEKRASGARRVEVERGSKGRRRMLCEVRKMNCSSGKNWQREQSTRGSERGVKGVPKVLKYI